MLICFSASRFLAINFGAGAKSSAQPKPQALCGKHIYRGARRGENSWGLADNAPTLQFAQIAILRKISSRCVAYGKFEIYHTKAQRILSIRLFARRVCVAPEKCNARGDNKSRRLFQTRVVENPSGLE